MKTNTLLRMLGLFGLIAFFASSCAAPVAPPTPVALAPTNVPPTVQPTPVADPSKLTWNTVISDTFDTIANDWTAGSFSFVQGKVIKSIADGKYTWNLKATQPFVYRDLPSMTSVGDAAISVDARQVGGTPDSAYGLDIRDDYRYYYVFLIADDQSYKFGTGNGTDTPHIIKSGTSDAIQPHAVNHLTVITQGSHFGFFVNSQLVAQAEADSYSRGVAGPVVELFHANDEAVFEFDNFQVSVPGVSVPGASVSQLGQWKTVITDWTASNPNGWATGDYSTDGATGSRTIVTNKYGWKTTNSVDAEVIAAPKMDPVKDLDVRVDAQQLSGGQKTEYGIVFRQASPGNEYLFVITGWGSYAFDGYVGGEYKSFTFPTSSGAIKPGQVNHLRVTAVGSHFTLYVNDQVVSQFDDATFAAGTVGLVVHAYDESIPVATFEFSNFELRAP